MKRNYGCIIIILIVSHMLYTMPDCQQIGKRLSSWNDAKNFTYTACACPCDEYPSLPKSQCSECKHYHLHGHQKFEFLSPNIHEAHCLYLQENS